MMCDYTNPLIHLEVVPVVGYSQRHVFPVWRPEDYRRLSDLTGKPILLDLGHAMITSRVLRLNPVEYIKSLVNELDIRIAHVADNDNRGDGCEDSHLHIGQGDVPIQEILRDNRRLEVLVLEVNDVAKSDIATVRKFLRHNPGHRKPLKH